MRIFGLLLVPLLALQAPAGAPDTILVRGQLVLVGGGVPRDGVVSLRTGDEAVDFADLWRALGGAKAVAAMHPLVLEKRIEALGGWRLAHTARADAEGRFALAVPRGTDRFWLEADGDGVALTESRHYALESAEVANGLVLALEPASLFEGIVRDPEGLPVSGARVFLQVGSWMPRNLTRSTKTDVSGRFRFPNVRRSDGGCIPYAAWLSAFAPGLGPAARGIESIEAPQAMDLALTKECAYEAIVFDSRGRPAGGLEIALSPRIWPAYAGDGYGFARADVSGRVRWTGLAPGSHHVSALRPEEQVWGSLRSGPESVEVSPQLASPTPIWTIPEPYPVERAVAGVVRDADGRPVEGARVEVRDGEGRTLAACPATKSDGAFRADRLPSGAARAVARLDNGLGAETEFDSGASDLVVVTLPPTSRVSVLARDARSGALLRGFSVSGSGRLADGRVQDLGKDDDRARDGTAVVDHVVPGVYDLYCAATDYTEQRMEGIALDAGGTVSLEFSLEPAATIRGRVVDGATGVPLSGAWVWSRTSRYWTRRPSDTEGRFVLCGLPGGCQEILASCAGRAPTRSEHLDVVAGGTLEIPDLVMLPGGSIDGRILERALWRRGSLMTAALATEPLLGVRPLPARIALWKRDDDGRKRLDIDPSTAFPHATRHLTTVIGTDGAFRFDDLEPGKWILRSRNAFAHGWLGPVLFERVVEVRRGETTDVVID